MFPLGINDGSMTVINGCQRHIWLIMDLNRRWQALRWLVTLKIIQIFDDFLDNQVQSEPFEYMYRKQCVNSTNDLGAVVQAKSIRHGRAVSHWMEMD